MNFTVAVKLAREVETLCVWAGDCDCVVPEHFCEHRVIRAEDGVLQPLTLPSWPLRFDIREIRLITVKHLAPQEILYGPKYGHRAWAYLHVCMSIYLHIWALIGYSLQWHMIIVEMRLCCMNLRYTFAHWSWLLRHGHVRAACQAGVVTSLALAAQPRVPLISWHKNPGHQPPPPPRELQYSQCAA